MIDEKAVEVTARALCIAAGYEPESWADNEDLRARCLKYARAAIIAYESARPKEAEGWQDIASASRNLKAVLGYQATPGDLEGQMAICWPMGPSDKPAVWIGEGGLMPTHWRPLPEPPSARSASAAARGETR